MKRVGEVRTYQVTNFRPDDRLYFDLCRPVLIDLDRNYSPVRTKADFYRRFYRGEFGNYGPMWSSLRSWEQSGYDKPIAIRTLVQGGRCDYDIPPEEVQLRTAEFLQQGWKRLNWSAMAPTERTRLQGEIQYGPAGLELFVSQEKLPMRKALAASATTVIGSRAWQTLRWACDGASFDMLQLLLDRYPDHVIEFSSFQIPWGVIPGMNTVVWEVRQY